MPYGALVEAEFEDGFVLTEDEADVSPYDEGRNVFHAILNGRPCAAHGQMVRWSLVTNGKTYSIDWKELWQFENPRPIYYRNMTRDFDAGGRPLTDPICLAHFFGYQYNAEDGSNVQEIQEIAV